MHEQDQERWQVVAVRETGRTVRGALGSTARTVRLCALTTLILAALVTAIALTR